MHDLRPACRVAAGTGEVDVSGQDEQVPSPEGATADDGISAEMMHLLHEGVPLTLIADLASPGGPHSPEILAEEGLPDVGWLGERDQTEADEDESSDLDDALEGLDAEDA